MSENSYLTQPGQTELWPRARCSPTIAAIYRRKEGDPWEVEIARTNGVERIRLIASVVCERLGPDGWGCEINLRAAVWRWLLTSCSTPAAWGTYIAHLCRWIRATGRRSLSAQTDTSPRQLLDFLFALEGDGLAPRSIVGHRETLRSWFRWLYDRDFIRRMPITREAKRAFPVDRNRVVKADGTRQSLSQEEAQRVAGWALSPTTSPEAGLSVVLQMVAGLRSAEVANMERRNIVEREGLVTATIHGKGHRTRTIVLEPVVIEAWRRYINARRRQGERGPLLVAPGGGHYSPKQVQRWAKMAAAIVGREKQISSHDLRRTAVSLLVDHGAALPQAQEFAGHAFLETTVECYVTRKPRMDATTGVTPEATAGQETPRRIRLSDISARRVLPRRPRGGGGHRELPR